MTKTIAATAITVNGFAEIITRGSLLSATGLCGEKNGRLGMTPAMDRATMCGGMGTKDHVGVDLQRQPHSGYYTVTLKTRNFKRA